MSWADTMRATALATPAERTVTASQLFADTPWRWNPHDVWLTRVGQPRERAAQSSLCDPATPSRQGSALRV
jgi:hypothetical protein